MRLIDADALVDTLNELGVPYRADVQLAIFEASTIDAVPRWIPCEERLPDDGKDVLISYRYKEGEGDTSHVYIALTSYGRIWVDSIVDEYKGWRQPFQFFHSNYEVIAWMPLPEPYEGERKDDGKSCDTCKHYDKWWDDIICDGCTKAYSNWERKDDEWVEE